MYRYQNQKLHCKFYHCNIESRTRTILLKDSQSRCTPLQAALFCPVLHSCPAWLLKAPLPHPHPRDGQAEPGVDSGRIGSLRPGRRARGRTRRMEHEGPAGVAAPPSLAKPWPSPATRINAFKTGGWRPAGLRPRPGHGQQQETRFRRKSPRPSPYGPARRGALEKQPFWRGAAWRGAGSITHPSPHRELNPIEFPFPIA